MRRESNEEEERLSVNNLLYTSGYKREKDDLPISRMAVSTRKPLP